MAVDYTWNSSYIFGIDNESGWGERYFFTYFSQFNKRSISIIAFEVCILIGIFLISVVANVSIIFCVIRFPDMRTVTNCFVLNLAAADLLFTFTIPAVAYTRIVSAWKLGDYACRIIPYLQFVSGIVLLWTLALISMDRHRCIVIPPYRSPISPRQSALLSLFLWLSSSLLSAPLLLWFRPILHPPICTLIFPTSPSPLLPPLSACFILPTLAFACILPMLALCYHYQRIFHKLISTRTTWASSCVVVAAEAKSSREGRRQSELSISDIFVPWPRKHSGGGSPTNRQVALSHHEELRLNKHIKVVRVLFLNVVLVLIMWLPITIVILLIFIDGRRANDDRNYFLRSYHFIGALIVAFLNTLVNPIVYGVMSDGFRACLVRLWGGGRGREVTPSSGRNNLARTVTTMRKQSFINSVSEN